MSELNGKTTSLFKESTENPLIEYRMKEAESRLDKTELRMERTELKVESTVENTVGKDYLEKAIGDMKEGIAQAIGDMKTTLAKEVADARTWALISALGLIAAVAVIVSKIMDMSNGM